MTERSALERGDYRVGSGTLVERKTVRGLHHAVLEGRLWQQLHALRLACASPWLLVEGEDLDNGPLRSGAVRGTLLAATDIGVRVLRTMSVADTASWLHLLARRRQFPARKRRPWYAQKPRAESPEEAMLAAAPGISVVTARRLLERFGSVEAVVAADMAELQTIHGVGAARARSLRSVICSFAPSAKEAGPST